MENNTEKSLKINQILNKLGLSFEESQFFLQYLVEDYLINKCHISTDINLSNDYNSKILNITISIKNDENQELLYSYESVKI